MPGALSVVVRPHWIGAWFLRVAARPVAVVDGVEHPARWGVPVRLEVAAGSRRVGAGMRYRGSRSLLGLRPREIEVPEGGSVRVLARNGPLDREPFFIHTAGPTD